MKGWIGWLVLVLFILSWDLVAALTNSDSLTGTFRRAIADTSWRWPVLVVLVLIGVHLFLPSRYRAHDPLDRAYNALRDQRLREERTPSSVPPRPRDDANVPKVPGR